MVTTYGYNMATNNCHCCFNNVLSRCSGSYSPSQLEKVDSSFKLPPKTGKRFHLSSLGCGTTFDLDEKFESSRLVPSNSGKMVSLVSFEVPKYDLKDEGGNSSKPSASGNNNEGTIVNNFYANNYYGSIDATGTTVGSGKSPESTLGSLVNAAGSLAGSLLMDQETEETTNIADRVLTEKVSNTAINTQSAVGRLLAYSAKDSGVEPISCSDKPTKAQPGNERFYTVNLATWTKTQKAYDIVTFTPALELGQFVSLYSSTQHQHFLEKCGWRVQVQCNTSQFHTGSLLVFMAPEFPKFHYMPDTGAIQAGKLATDYINWYPFPDIDWFKPDNADTQVTANWYSQTKEQWPLYPHQILNCRTGTSVSIEVPYAGVTPTSHRPQHNGWTLVVAVLTPLDYSSGAATAIQITASFCPVNPVWNGLRHMTLSHQSPVPTQVREHKGQFLSTLPDKTVPTYGRCKGPSDYQEGEIEDLVQIGQLPTFVSNYASDTSTESLPYFEVTSATSSGNLLFEANVILTDRKLLRTAAAATALNFTQYSGSTIYTFMFCGTAMHKVKFLISYTPPGAGKPQNIEDANQGTYAIWDVGLNSTFKFTIPFISPSERRFTFNGNATELDVDGWLTVYQLTPLTYPANCPSAAKIVVMFSFGPDFSLHNPVTPMLNQGTTNAEEGAPDVQSPSVDFTAHDVPTPLLTQSNLGFFYDRSFFAGSIVPYSMDDTTQPLQNKNVMLLTPHFSVGLNQVLSRVDKGWEKWSQYCYGFLAACPFTYYKADLEITVIPRNSGTSVVHNVHWFPCGAHLPTTRFGEHQKYSLYAALFSTQPVATNHGFNPVSFTVPYTSPLSYMAIDYDGKNAFKNGTYGVCPANNFGAIVVSTSNANVDSVRFSVYFRFKNFRGFCPRPYRMVLRTLNNRLRPNTTEGMAPGHRMELFDCPDVHTDFPENFGLDTTDEEEEEYQDMEDHSDILLGGDIEENPGPDSLMEAVVKDLIEETSKLPPDEAKSFKSTLKNVRDTASKFAKKLKPKKEKDSPAIDTNAECAFLAFLEAEDPVDTMAKGWKAISEIQHLWASVKRLFADAGFWYDILCSLLKYVISTLIWILNPTTSVTLGLAAMAAIDLVSMRGLKTKILDYLTPKLGTPPDIPDGLFDEPPSLLNKVKGAFGLSDQMDLKDEAGENAIKHVQTANHTFNLLKNLEWITTTIKKLFDWLASWFKQPEATKQQVLEEKMKLFAPAVDEIQSYRSGETNTYPEASSQLIKEIFSLATETGRTGLANLASKFMIARTNNTPRMEPVVVVLRGKPGTGKSVASHILAQALSKQMSGRQSVYSFPPDCDHLDGYTGQYCVVMDDLGQNPDGEDFSTFCQMVSTTNYIPPMANLEDKGRPFCSNVVIATTNLPVFSPVTVADPAAVERRIFLDLDVTPGHACLINGKLDLEAALEPIGPAVGPFRQDCELLHTAGLCFTDRRTRTQYSLLDVFNMVEERIKTKAAVKKNLMNLVFEGPNDPPSFEDFILRMNLATAERDIIVREMRELKQSVHEGKELQMQFYSLVLVIGGLAGLCYAMYNITKVACEYFLPDTPPTETEVERAPFLEPAQVQGAYDGKVPKKPIATKKLQLQGPGTPDFEKFLACHMVTPIHFFMTENAPPSSQSALLLFDRCFMVNTHTWEKDWFKFEIRGVAYSREQCDWLDLYKEGVRTDATVVQLPKGQMFKNNINKFVSNDQTFPQKNTPVTAVNCQNGTLFYTGHIIRSPQTCEIIRGLSSSMFIYAAQTYPGYCGSAITSTIKGKKVVLGMHSAGNSGTAGGIYITQQDLRRVKHYFDQKQEETPAKEEKLADEGFLTELEDGPVIHVPRKTKIRKSPAFPTFKPAAGPAVLSQNDPRLDPDVDFDKQVFSKHVINQKIYPEQFKRMMIWYADWIMTYLGKDNGPLSIKDAIKGINFLDAMDPNTSPGLPYSAAGISRTDLIDFDQGEIISAALSCEYNKYVDGDYSDHCFQTFLKDEIRTEEKIKRGKTRIVDVPSLAHVLMGRVLLGRFCSKFQASPGTVTGSAIGCDPDTDWTRFAHQLTEKAWCYDIDYSNFDSTHGTGMFELLIECFFTESNGFSPKVAPYLRSLASSKHAWMEKRYLIEGGLPSGCSATSVLNTIMNNVIIRALLAMTYQNFHPEDVAVLAYGDDLLVASDYILDFNRVRDVAAEHTLYQLTTANKAPSFPETSTLLECRFLKRRFVLHSTRHFIWRPVMDKANLETMLSFYKPNTLSEKLLSVARLAFHSGYQTYEELFKPFKEFQMRVPSWYLLEHEWESNFD
uniref:Genome polyprotein n=1 Tax=Miniopterus bat picornavirus TaxID=3141889 RepID=A0AAU7E343_9VIRU